LSRKKAKIALSGTIVNYFTGFVKKTAQRKEWRAERTTIAELLSSPFFCMVPIYTFLTVCLRPVDE
jgi:hypothetical protein